jgi:hypothetical protein
MFDFSAFRKLRSNRPNPTSNTIPSATWPATKPFRNRRDRRPPARFGTPSFKSSTFTRVACNAGMMPNVSALRSETPKLTANTRASTCKYTPGSMPAAMVVIITSHHRARITATTPLQMDSSMLSTRNCRIILAREQPSAVRTATSRCRFTTRAISKLAMFAHAIKRTSPAATAVISKPRSAFFLVGPGCRSVSPKSSTTRRSLLPPGVSGVLSRAAITSASDRACSNVAPCRRRATISTLAFPALTYAWLR